MEPAVSDNAADYRFGDVVVQTRSRRVLREGTEIPLEPKAYAVLLELLGHPGSVVERDRLLDAVWGHRFVTPGVLNRVIAILRRSLGDDADHPRYIRTVHGVGYSFIGSLEPEAEPAPPGESIVAAPQPEPALAHRGRPWAILLVIAGVVALAAVWAARDQLAEGRPPVGAPGTAALRLALLPITAEDPTDELLARGLTDVLGEALARIPEFELVELESARLAVARTDDPAEIADLLGTDRLLRIRLGRKAGDAVLEVELLGGGNGHSPWTMRLAQPRNALTGVVEPLLSSLRQQLMPGAPAGPVDPIVRADAVAQALYLQNRISAPEDAEGRARNRALLERAVEQDPEFALGWAALANARRVRYAFGEVDLDEAMTGAEEAVDRALALDPDLVEALNVQSFIKTNQWRSPEALGPSRRAIELAPNDARAVATRANVLGYLARPREAIELRRRAVALNPLSPVPVWGMSADYLMLGDREHALEQIAEAQRMRGTRTDDGAYPARLELAFGRPVESLRRYRDNPRQVGSYAGFVPLTAVQALVSIGEVGQAEALFESLHPPLPQAPLYLDARMGLYWSNGRFAEAVGWLDGPGRNAAPQPWLTVARAHARALAGDLEGALADYASGLEGPADRELIFNNWWPTRFGPAELGNWIALRKASGQDHAAELKDFGARLARAESAGVRIPVLGYYRAMLAALHDDEVAADAALTEARNMGWFDPVALDVDLAWRPYRNAAWFQAQQRWLDDKAARERTELAAAERH